MTLNKIIAVDFSRESATSQVILPPNLSSDRTHWKGIYLQYHDCSSHETPEHYPTQHVIAIQTQGIVKAERKLGDRFKQEQIRPGDVCLVPARTRHWINSQGKQGLILLSLEPSFLADTVPDSIDRKNAELLPHFARADPLIYHIGLSLKTALEINSADSHFYVEALGVALTAHLMQFYTAEKYLLPIDIAPEEAKIQRAKDYIQAHLTENLSLKAIAATIDLSQHHFCRVFKKTTGLSPWQYVIQQKIALAEQLLRNPQLTVAQISRQLGYSTSAQFSNFFRHHTGVTPSAYRNN